MPQHAIVAIDILLYIFMVVAGRYTGGAAAELVVIAHVRNLRY